MKSRYEKMDIDELIANFIETSVEQGQALESFQTTKYNKLFDIKIELINEMKHRNGDQRRALFALYGHPDIQVRMNAAKATYALDAGAARAELEAIVLSQRFPWAAHAGMTLWSLDEGIGKLD